MILGRKEYTERHRKFVVISLGLFILSIVLSSIIMVVGIVMALVNNDTAPIGNAMYAIPIASIIGGIVYVFLLYELEDKNGKIVLISAVILTVMTSTFLAINIQSVFEQTFGSINISQEEITELSNTFSQKVSELSAFSIIHNLVMLLAFFMAYKRIDSGDIPSSKIDKSSLQSGKDEWYCPHCGRAVPTDANICPYYGKQM
ncbi:MAG: zinc ribbon domain-containing protein [Candidatus Thermoplasmatota archaeon]|nr:zinc ribbon domain-containing protein [Candidatus Thermoplasmatota archaeon]